MSQNLPTALPIPPSTLSTLPFPLYIPKVSSPEKRGKYQILQDGKLPKPVQIRPGKILSQLSTMRPNIWVARYNMAGVTGKRVWEILGSYKVVQEEPRPLKKGGSLERLGSFSLPLSLLVDFLSFGHDRCSSGSVLGRPLLVVGGESGFPQDPRTGFTLSTQPHY